jgi:hypothetical protein
MPVVYERCCGLDGHKRTVVACILLSQPDGSVQREVRTFGTMTAELLALADWVNALAGGHVAMESRGVFWRPVFTLLEDGHDLLLMTSCWSIPSTSSASQATRRTSRTPNGWRTCCGTASSPSALCHRNPSATCAS